MAQQVFVCLKSLNIDNNHLNTTPIVQLPQKLYTVNLLGTNRGKRIAYLDILPLPWGPA